MIFTPDIKNDLEAPPLVIKAAEALESGEYEQTKGWLKRERERKIGWCCLGVMCDVSKLGEWHEHRLHDGRSWIYETSLRPSEGYAETPTAIRSTDIFIPTVVQRAFCLRTWTGTGIPAVDVRTNRPGMFSYGKTDVREVDLTALNDNDVPFTEIARILREHLERALR